jgi:transcription initiation factor TFIIIB Brf1 subunit/transcription initiation factor TFIIB
MSDDLVERLLSKTHESDGLHGIFEVLRNPDGPEAATTLQQQRREIEALTKEANDHAEAASRWRAKWGDAVEQIEVLREALEPFAQAGENAVISGRPPGEFVGANLYIKAREALLSTPDDKTNGL